MSIAFSDGKLTRAELTSHSLARPSSGVARVLSVSASAGDLGPIMAQMARIESKLEEMQGESSLRIVCNLFGLTFDCVSEQKRPPVTRPSR